MCLSKLPASATEHTDQEQCVEEVVWLPYPSQLSPGKAGQELKRKPWTPPLSRLVLQGPLIWGMSPNCLNNKNTELRPLTFSTKYHHISPLVSKIKLRL